MTSVDGSATGSGPYFPVNVRELRSLAEQNGTHSFREDAPDTASLYRMPTLARSNY
jgi:hypothetical protein